MAKILLGISGSIAAIKTPLLIHELIKQQHQCKVIITRDGLDFVTPIAISALGAEVYLDETSHNPNKVMEHIDLAKWAEYILIVPTTANTLAKLAHGFADNLLNSTILASNAIKIIVPAMNQQMWKNSLTQENLQRVGKTSYHIWGPSFGLQACGDIDVGRMLEVEEILHNFAALNNTDNSLRNKNIVITAGGTQEPIDPVRYIGNHSSGKMGYALATEAINRGAQVTLISGITSITPPSGLANYVPVTTAHEMLSQALLVSKGADIFIGCAAVCDFKAARISRQKIKKLSHNLVLELEANEDIIAKVKRTYPNIFAIGFAAETENLETNAITKLKTKQLDLIIANDVSDNKVFAKDITTAMIINRNLEVSYFGEVTKTHLARIIFDKILQNNFKTLEE